MPFRQVVTEELGKLLKVLAHPDRIYIIEELNQGEREVKALQAKLGISHSRVSQHLAQLRAMKIVTERRKGRHVLYRLVNPDLAHWLLDALQFIEFRLQKSDQIRSAVQDARNLWQEQSTEEQDSDDGENLIYITGRGKQ